jgi:formyltetrahydrofolate deformylase
VELAPASERLLVNCPDRPGIVARVTTFLAERGANILDLDQHSDVEDARFAMRVVYAADASDHERIRDQFVSVAADLRMQYHFASADTRPPVAILCSPEDHCLLDLLWRFDSGELQGTPALVASTVDDHAAKVSGFGLPYEVVPVTTEGGMPAHERRLLELLAGRVELVVLARYMRILSDTFLQALGCPAINIHHSFLPAFAGADPYARAHARGVKLIGATAHYVTAELDAGPIIEQDVVRVTHRHDSDDLRRIGRDVERVVLARAVRAHLEDRVVTWGERTVVF